MHSLKSSFFNQKKLSLYVSIEPRSAELKDDALTTMQCWGSIVNRKSSAAMKDAYRIIYMITFTYTYWANVPAFLRND